MSEQRVRICIIGDELVAGVGDPRGQGWVGRVFARTQATPPCQFYPLAVPGEVTTMLNARWDEESSRRFSSETDNRLVIGLGRADLDANISLARSRLNLANILDACAERRISTFVVGPPPTYGARRDSSDWYRIGELSEAFADVSGRRRVPFIDLYQPLRDHEQWRADLAQDDGVPGQAGYGLIAWLILHNGWHDWLGIPTRL